MLEHHVAPRAEVNEELALGGTDTSEGIDPSKAHRWVRRATDDQQAQLADMRDAMADWGYRLDDPFHVGPEQARHAELLTRQSAARPRPTAATPAPPAGRDPDRLAAELDDSRRAREALIARIEALRTPQRMQEMREEIERLRGQLDTNAQRLERVREDFARFRGRRSVRAAVRLAGLFGR